MIKNYKEAININKDFCLNSSIEKSSKLAYSITQIKNNTVSKNRLAEEIADVLICMEWLVNMYNVEQDLIEDWLKIKEDAIVKQINKEI